MHDKIKKTLKFKINSELFLISKKSKKNLKKKNFLDSNLDLQKL